MAVSPKKKPSARDRKTGEAKSSPTRKAAAPTTRPPNPPQAPQEPWLVRLIDGIYHFLASVKLAVISILSLAVLLAYATFFNASYGLAAAQEYVYGSPLFAAVLAFLGINIFCAASIRFRWDEHQKGWTKRQTGFVITHAGLLVTLVGAFIASRTSYEGQIPIAETTKSNELVRMNQSVLRVEKLDPKTGQSSQRWELPFRPGPFDWSTQERAKDLANGSYLTQAYAWRGALVGVGVAWLVLAYIWAARRPVWLSTIRGTAGLTVLTACFAVLWGIAASHPLEIRQDVLTSIHDPIRVVVRDFLPSSTPAVDVYEPSREESSQPAVRLAMLSKPPNADEFSDQFESEGWFYPVARELGRDVRDAFPARIIFQNLTGPWASALLEDFLTPPEKPLETEQVRFHYKDREGRPRVLAWPLADRKAGDRVELPDSDLVLVFEEKVERSAQGAPNAAQASLVAEADGMIRLVRFKLQAAGRPETELIGLAGVPTFSTDAGDDHPDHPGHEAHATAGLVQVNYERPPGVSGVALQGVQAQIELAAGPDGKLYHRIFNRSGLKSIGPLETGKTLALSTPEMPMQLALRVDEFLPRANRLEVCKPLDLPVAKKDEAIPACRITFAAGGSSRDVWVRRTYDYSTRWQTVRLDDGDYRISYDFVRERLPFEIELVKFEPGKFPGANSFTSYRSDILLDDPELNIEDQPHAVFMNHVLDHRGYTFYQQSFRRVADPETGQRDGVYESTLLAHHNPARNVIYAGCLLVVIGTFVQFYMRSGAFSFRRKGASSQPAPGKLVPAGAELEPL
jgi:hypothetical protein